MLTVITGDIRQGKTLLLSILSYYSERKNIYANYRLTNKKFTELTPEHLFYFSIPNDTDVFIDEAYAWLESRTSGKNINKAGSYILFQSGKREIDIYLVIQLLGTVDKRFREMANFEIKCYKNDIYQIFQYDFYQRVQGQNVFLTTWLLPFNQAKYFFDIYDTFQIIEPYSANQMQLNYILEQPEKTADYVKKIARELQDDGFEKLTHDNLKYEMLNRGYPIKLEKFVYIALKKYLDK